MESCTQGKGFKHEPKGNRLPWGEGSSKVGEVSRRRILLFSALAVALVIAVVIILATSGESPSVTTADGRRVKIEKVTFGTHHRFIQGKLWVRLLRPIRGKRWAAQHGCYETRFTNDRPALVVWARWEGISALNPAAVEATILDERGTESELVAYRSYSPNNNRGSPAYVAWSISNFPRRSARTRVRFYDRDKRYVPKRAAELAFSNPTRKRVDDWNGSKLPLGITTNHREFALTSIQQTSNALWRLNFVVRTNGVIDPSWLVGGVTASSASGNLVVIRSNLPTASTTNLAFQLRGALWPEEPMWRFGVEFVQAANFRPAELWTLTNLAIPPRNMPFQLTTNLLGPAGPPLQFRMESIPRMPPPLYGSRRFRRNANILVHFEARDRHLLLVEATDDRGRPIESEVDFGAPRTIYAFGLAIPDSARSVDLRFAVRRFVRVDFDVLSTSFSRANVPVGVDRSRN